MIDTTEFDCFSGHAEDDARFFILRDIESAGLLHFEHATGAIVTHSGHNYANGIGTSKAGGGTEEDIDGRAVATDQRTIV